MATNFAASVKDWAERTKAAQKEVMQQSLQDVLEAASTTQQSMARGATGVKVGAIPVDTGHLAATFTSELNGSGSFSTDQTGAGYALTIEQMEPGDTAHFAWTAEYAMAIELGHGTYPGAHFVGVAAAQWPAIVAANAEKLKP